MASVLEAPAKVRGAADPMVPRAFRVGPVRQELADTFTLTLTPEDADDPCAFAPGQFNMLYVPGVGEVPISISGDPARRRVFTHTTRVVGTVTRAMRECRRGSWLGVRGPFGSQWPVDRARDRDVVIVAGGIGLAPLRPAMYSILARRASFGRVVLLYGTRTPDDILFRKELERWRASFDLEVHVTVDRASGDWRGNVGVVTSLIPKVPFDPSGAMAFVCGPEVMMRFTALELIKRGVAPDRIALSMERNMKCAIGLCGHCQWGPLFVCRDGPVFTYDRIKDLLTVWEL
jgi:NAD(P)H-flavin reductase